MEELFQNFLSNGFIQKISTVHGNVYAEPTLFFPISRAVYLDQSVCSPQIINALMSEKDAIGQIFKDGRSYEYNVTRDRILLSAEIKDAKHASRAAYKLTQIIDMVPNFFCEGAVTFLDICGGPGSWSLYLLGLDKVKNGFGVTILSDVPACNWYKELYNNARWEEITTNNGDIKKYSTIEDILRKIGKNGVQVVLCDGADNCIPNGIDENLQELYNGILFTAQIFAAVLSVSKNGTILCKYFDGISVYYKSIIYILTTIFEDVYIVKPKSSRVVNGERYVVCTNFMGRNTSYFKAIDIIRGIYVSWQNMNNFPTALTYTEMCRDDTFNGLYTKTSNTLCDLQIYSMIKVRKGMSRKRKKT